MKYVVCFSGGHASALAAVETVRQHGTENTVLLNHNISPEVEHADIKRFKSEVAAFLGLPITYANMPGWETLSPLKIAVAKGGFQYRPGQALCTYNLKTAPFYRWLKENYPVPNGGTNKEITLVYGFDLTESHRITRRSNILGVMGYLTEFPLIVKGCISDISECGLEKPCVYENQKHANCIGCLKAGRQHWYLVYCQYPALFAEALAAEEQIGYSIIKGVFLEELLPTFQQMKARGITPQDIEQPQTFWARVRRELTDEPALPCECAI